MASEMKGTIEVAQVRVLRGHSGVSQETRAEPGLDASHTRGLGRRAPLGLQNCLKPQAKHRVPRTQDHVINHMWPPTLPDKGCCPVSAQSP